MPEWRHAIRKRLEGLHLSPAREAELIEELSQHLEDRYHELCSGGASTKTAMREALNELDDCDLVRELSGVERQEAQEPLALGKVRGGGIAAGLWQDVRFGARLVAKEKSVTLVVVMTLGLAIAANTIIFSFTDLLLLRPLPWGNAARLVEINTVDRRQNNLRASLSVPQYLDVVRRAASFESVAALTPRQLSLTGSGEPAAVGALRVTANFFRTVGLETVAGRPFVAGEDTPGQSNVVVLSHRFWNAHFNRDLTLIGRTITLNGVAHTVIGVLTPEIELGSLVQVDLWLPLETAAAANRLSERVRGVFGLLRQGQTLAMANADLATISEHVRREYPMTDVDVEFRAISARDSNVSQDTWVLLALLTTVVGLVLLLACANVATVMLAHASTRRREIALRLALGATRTRLVRQLISEGLLLGLLAGAIGVLLASAGLAGIKSLSAEQYIQLLSINANVLSFAFALSVATPVLFGVVPAVQASRPDLTEDLKEGARDSGPSLRSHRSRATLVAAQVAFALTVLIVSGLVIRSGIGLQHVALGVIPDSVLCTRVRFDPPKYDNDDARLRAVDSLVTRIAAVPGVVSAAAMSRMPIVDAEPLQRFTIAGQPTPAAAEVPWAVEATMAGSYRETFRLPVVEGRLWTDDESRSSTSVAVVSREAARRYWPSHSAVGQRIVLMNPKDASAGESIAIVGVVDDVKTSALSQPAPPRIYRPLEQRPAESVAFAVRVRGEGLSVAPLIREALRAEDRDLAASEIRSLTAMIDTLLRGNRLVIGLFLSFAAIGLVLAVTGVYGVTAFSVSQRQHEIGVRLALGATVGDVIRPVVTRGFRPVAIGIGIGAVGGWAIANAMRGVLFQTGPLDPSTYVIVTALIAIGGLMASVIPARRAASIDPTSVLRRE